LCDPVRLRQILLNLLTNAVKFTERGTVAVRVTATDQQDRHILCRFEVIDTGIGLSPEQAATLFTAFAQAESSTTRLFGGTGLGLSICRSLAEMMGGRIGVQSELRVGSTFWFELPLEPLAEQPAPPAQDLAGLRLLVVDDLPEARETMAGALRLRGAEVLEAGTMLEAAAALRAARPPDLALIDLPEPLEALLNSLTQRIGHGRVMPMLPSGHGAAAIFCEEHGFLPPLSKPVRAAVLARTVAAAMGRTATETTETSSGGAPEALRLTAEQALAAGRLVLVAEDNAVNRLVIAKQLTELGHCFEIAHDGEAAWQLLRAKPFGLLLSDCTMPVLDGYDLARRIRAAEADSGTPRLPVVALTANVSQGEVEKCRLSGFDDYLSKPVVLTQLAACLDEWLPPVGETAPPDEPAAVSNAGPDVKSALLDIDQFALIVGSHDREVLAEVLGYFVETFQVTFFTLREALTAKDRKAFSIAAHTAKGAARAACAPVLADMLQEIEDRSLTRDSFAKLGQRLDAAEQAFLEVRALIGSGAY
jgi:CheY-like chemotaxis protein/HPt (histidine-containing phosphotransfer) domain-containing protein